jgi:hypothetical protein
MNKEEGSKTVVIGGKSDVQQQYCGTVGGQSTDYSTVDTDIKARRLTPCWSLRLSDSILFGTDYSSEDQPPRSS